MSQGFQRIIQQMAGKQSGGSSGRGSPAGLLSGGLGTVLLGVGLHDLLGHRN